MLFPLSANQKKLRRNHIHQLIQILIGDAAVVICQHTASRLCEPYFGRRCRRLSFGDMHMNRFSVFIRPEEYDIFADLEQFRHSESLRFRRT